MPAAGMRPEAAADGESWVTTDFVQARGVGGAARGCVCERSPETIGAWVQEIIGPALLSACGRFT
jgi:hypothetical protein